MRDAEHRASHDIEVAWAEAAGAFDRLDLTSRIVAEAVQAQSLAQSRYDERGCASSLGSRRVLLASERASQALSRRQLLALDNELTAGGADVAAAALAD